MAILGCKEIFMVLAIKTGTILDYLIQCYTKKLQVKFTNLFCNWIKVLKNIPTGLLHFRPLYILHFILFQYFQNLELVLLL